MIFSLFVVLLLVHPSVCQFCRKVPANPCKNNGQCLDFYSDRAAEEIYWCDCGSQWGGADCSTDVTAEAEGSGAEACKIKIAKCDNEMLSNAFKLGQIDLIARERAKDSDKHLAESVCPLLEDRMQCVRNSGCWQEAAEGEAPLGELANCMDSIRDGFALRGLVSVQCPSINCEAAKSFLPPVVTNVIGKMVEDRLPAGCSKTELSACGSKMGTKVQKLVAELWSTFDGETDLKDLEDEYCPEAVDMVRCVKEAGCWSEAAASACEDAAKKTTVAKKDMTCTLPCSVDSEMIKDTEEDDVDGDGDGNEGDDPAASAGPIVIVIAVTAGLMVMIVAATMLLFMRRARARNSNAQAGIPSNPANSPEQQVAEKNLEMQA